MDCNKISYFLIDYLDENLDKKIYAEVKLHLENCEKCTRELSHNQKLFKEIDNADVQLPGNELKKAFVDMLEKEKRMEDNSGISKVSLFTKYKMVWQIAAAVLLLFTGYFLGSNKNNISPANDKLTEMHNELTEVKQMMALSLLNNESASQRIKAVNYTEEIQQPDNKIIEALINTLNTDKNSNVRLAAVYSLSRFKNNKTVQEAFIRTLNRQNDPMIQIVIINLLVEIQDVKAVDEIKKLLQNKDLHEEVKTQAELGVKVLS